jgi:hypothetical protein
VKPLLAIILSASLALAQDRDLTGYTLVFSDEFDTLSVGHHENKGDKTWSQGAPYGPASSFSRSHWWVLPEWQKVGQVEDGIFKLYMLYAPETPLDWVSPIIASMDRKKQGFAQRFGYWSARIKMPNAGQGAWPAFWLASTAGIPSGGGDGYEIDIMEFYGGILTPGEPPRYNQGPFYDFLVHAWQNTGGQDEAFSGGRGHIPLSDPVANWHVFGCEVNPQWIIGYLDGAEVARVPTSARMIDKPLYIIINYALQNWHSGEPFASLEAKGIGAMTPPMEVDWVRAYSLPGLSDPANLRITGP